VFRVYGRGGVGKMGKADDRIDHMTRRNACVCSMSRVSCAATSGIDASVGRLFSLFSCRILFDFFPSGEGPARAEVLVVAVVYLWVLN